MSSKENPDGQLNPNEFIQSFQPLLFDEKLLFQFVELLPFGVELFYPDGTTAFVNKALLKEQGIASADLIVGKYNVLKDPVTLDLCGLREPVFGVFRGETHFVYDVKVPLTDLVDRYKIKDFDLESIYNDLVFFPIKDGDSNILYAACIFFTRRSYRGRQEILEAKEYIKSHLLEEFDINQVAQAVSLSSYHFLRLFKKHVGQTPYNYYLDLKFDLLKGKLIDPNLTAAQAFEASGLPYNGHYAGMFKKKFDLSPVQYRQRERRKNDKFQTLKKK